MSDQIDIFEKNFLNLENEKIISQVRNEGVFFCKNAIKDKFIDNFLNEVDENKFSINRNWTTGVYTENQYLQYSF